MKKSESINELATALAKAQGELRDAPKDSQGYGYNYADLSACLEIARPILSANGLSVIQLPYTNAEVGNSVGIETVLAHSSGQWISEQFAMPVEVKKGLSGAQCYGSIITYARRYALAALIGISQTDDDASPQGAAQPTAQKPKASKRPNPLPREDAVPEMGQTSDDEQHEKNRKRIWAKAIGLWGRDDARGQLEDTCKGPGWTLGKLTIKQQDMLITTLSAMEMGKNK